MASPSYPAGPDTPLPPHLDPRGRHRGARSYRSGATRIALIVFTVLSLSALILSGYVWFTFRSIDNAVPRLKVAVGVAPTGHRAPEGTDQNILLVGNDDRTNMTDAEVALLKVGRDGGSKATDTMMIVHIPANGSKATLISLPRDSYVSIPGHGMDRLNSAYVYGYNDGSGTDNQRRTSGADLLIQTITNLTGLTINHYIQVSLMGFYEISNAIGGVSVTLCHAVNDTVEHNRALGSDGGSGLVLSKGTHVIQGVQALEFVRQRHGLPDGDLDRVRRQQYFLTAAFRKVASVGILFKLQALGTAVQRNIYLDPGLHLIDLAKQMENLSANNIIGKTIPTSFGTVNGASVLVVDKSQVQHFVDQVVSPATSSPARPNTNGPAPRPKASGSSTAPAIDAKCIN